MIEISLPVWTVVLLAGSVVALVFIQVESLIVIRTLRNRIRLLELNGGRG